LTLVHLADTLPGYETERSDNLMDKRPTKIILVDEGDRTDFVSIRKEVLERMSSPYLLNPELEVVIVNEKNMAWSWAKEIRDTWRVIIIFSTIRMLDFANLAQRNLPGVKVFVCTAHPQPPAQDPGMAVILRKRDSLKSFLEQVFA
jgi:hypothetical protein